MYGLSRGERSGCFLNDFLTEMRNFSLCVAMDTYSLSCTERRHEGRSEDSLCFGSG